MVAAFFLQAKSYPEASSQEGYGEGGGWGAKGSVEMQVTGGKPPGLRGWFFSVVRGKSV